jgi:hypothetical protein
MINVEQVLTGESQPQKERDFAQESIKKAPFNLVTGLVLEVLSKFRKLGFGKEDGVTIKSIMAVKASCPGERWSETWVEVTALMVQKKVRGAKGSILWKHFKQVFYLGDHDPDSAH